MALTPLTPVQQATVLALVEVRRLDVVPADVARAASFLRQAREFDRLRRARNQDRYEAKPVGGAATQKAEQVARTLFAAALARGISA